MSSRGAAANVGAENLARGLAGIVGEGHVLADDDLRAPYEHDFTGRYGAKARLVVRPADQHQVAAVVRLCAGQGAHIVPQGGNTGLVGGGVPRGGEILLSLARLTNLGAIDQTTGQLLAGAGATLASVQAAAENAGWEMPMDIGARDSATVGGLVATDAGGAMALAHGTMRARVAGLAAVLPDGSTIERLTGLLKDNAGYSWPSLLIGSEGTLAIITSVLLRLAPRPAQRVAALFGVRDAEAAMRVLVALRREVPSLQAADFFFDEGVTLVERELQNMTLPLAERTPCYVVAECAGAGDPLAELAQAAESAGPLILEQAAAEDTAGRRRLWQLREALPDALVRAGVPVKIDIAVPLAQVAEFSSEVRGAISAIAPNAETVLWGHLGDGNIHVNVLGAEAPDLVEERVLHLAAHHGGTISAEHGVGISKARHLRLVRSPEELTLMHNLKSAVDPAGIMNPGVMLPRATPSRNESSSRRR